MKKIIAKIRKVLRERREDREFRQSMRIRVPAGARPYLCRNGHVTHALSFEQWMEITCDHEATCRCGLGLYPAPHPADTNLRTGERVR